MSYQRVSTTARPSLGNKIIQVKVVLLGDQGVGKSSLALRFVRGEFSDSNEATIGAAFLTQMINVRNQTIKFDIWDTAGQERYHSLAPMYYRGAQAAIVAYDVTCVQSFERAMVWVQELRTQANPNILIVLAGNKADMASECRAVLTEDAKSFAEENKLMFAECSAKTGMAVNDIFNAVGSKLFNNPESKLQNSSMPHSSIRIQQIQQSENTKSTCC